MGQKALVSRKIGRSRISWRDEKDETMVIRDWMTKRGRIRVSGNSGYHKKAATT